MLKVTYSKLFLGTLFPIPLLVFLLWVANHPEDIASENQITAPDGFKVASSLPQLVKSEVIAIGTFGPIIARDHPGRYQLHFNDMSDMSEIEIEEWVLATRDTYHLIEIEEIVKGDPEIPFIIGYPDVEYYDEIDTLPLLEGQRVLFFADKDIQPELHTNKFEITYGALPDNAIFDIDESNRAFPRTPEIFDELTTDEGYYSEEDELQPYFDLDKLKLTIERMITEQEEALSSS